MKNRGCAYSENSLKKRSGKKERKLFTMRNIFTVAVFTFIICMSFGTFFVSAKETDQVSEEPEVYYKSIEIQPGDTLWDIARETMPGKYDSTAEYVQELMDMNKLPTDEIHSGQHLIIVCYR